MNNKVFNTVFEISMRLLLILSLSKKKKLTLDNLVTVDFISNYSKEFGLSGSNLHGDNEFSFSVITATSFYRLCHFIYHQMPCSVPLSDICRPSCDSKSVGQGIAAL